MKIKNVSCAQFAGIRNCNIDLTDGINVIYGKNESGKSTFVNLIGQTLFRTAKLNKRMDKDFLESFIPSIKKGSGSGGSSADGKITFETEKGIYTLTKEWGEAPRCVLDAPDDVIRDDTKIEAAVKEVLVYGKGVYANMLFASQRNADVSLKTILDASGTDETKRELTDAISRAFSESDGISVDAVEQAIKANIEKIVGDHWDIDKEKPETARNSSQRWTRGIGEIMKAYYAMEDAEKVLSEMAELEKAASSAAADYILKDDNFHAAEAAYNDFQAYASHLTLHRTHGKEAERLSHDISKAEDALAKWPVYVQNAQRAKVLETELENRTIKDAYDIAKSLYNKAAELKTQAAAMSCPEEEEISAVKNAQKRAATLENKLHGMNLNAAIKMLNGNQIEIRSIRTGEAINFSDSVVIEEAVNIIIPGIMEMTLSPTNIDVASVSRQITEQKAIISSILTKYKVQSLEELETLRKLFTDIQNEISKVENHLEIKLEGRTLDVLETAVNTISANPRDNTAIMADIVALCGNKDIKAFRIASEHDLKVYEGEYGSIEKLKEKNANLKAELEKVKKQISAMEDIPAEFKNIEDPESHLRFLQETLKTSRETRDRSFENRAGAESRLEAFNETCSDDPKGDAEKARRAFEEQKELLAHWRHIEDVFIKEKNNIKDNPLVDLTKNFADYLKVISGGRVVSEFPDADKLNLNIYSSDRLIDYGKLSEGTKETVFLAFRLAVLDHLFPEGGGIAILDDPFANMDAERTAQSVELVKACAKRHQVIFLTCKEEYCSMLGGSQIKI